MSNNNERIVADIQKAIREIVQYELKNETIGFLTITDIKVSSDRSYAKVYVSFFNNGEKNIEKLNKSKGYVRSALAKRIHTRRVPEVSFVLDDTFFKAQRVEEAIQKDEEDIENMKKEEKTN